MFHDAIDGDIWKIRIMEMAMRGKLDAVIQTKVLCLDSRQ